MEVLKHLASKRRLKAGVVIVGVLALLSAAANARAQVVSSEWNVKAVLIYNMAQFVEWPASAFSSTNSPLIIGVLGRDPFGKALDDVVRGESMRGHPLVVRRFATPADVGVCHILYISSRDAAEVSKLVSQLRRRPILTVGESDYFARRDGGMVRMFPTPEGKIRLRINIANVSAAGLKISSKLLRVAEVVNEPS